MIRPRVDVQQGTLEGQLCENSEASYIAYKGIPYAKPPIGELRFKAPEPPDCWQGVRDASEHGPVCPQFNERMMRLEEGSEDCLYLNVYIPKTDTNVKLPVMVWIHGGAFYTGSGNSDFYGPEFFMKNNVILVTINYRLEVLGFLCLDIEEVPGNAGLKDQVAALEWVKKNIEVFGGDSSNITIFGCSAGAASVSYHLISKMSEGLFNKAICQSGVCLNEWSYNIYPVQRAFQLGKLLGNDTKDPRELFDFLRTLPVSSLVHIKLAPLDTPLMDLSDSILFGPVIEKSTFKGKPFLSENPVDLVKSGHIANVPIIIGQVSGEGIEIARNYEMIKHFINSVGAVVPRELKLKLPEDKIRELDDKIRSHYFKEKETMQDFVNLETDVMFAYNMRRFAKQASLNNTPVYYYKFAAETERNYLKKLYNMESINGVCHADELHYLFHIECLDIPLTNESRHIIEHFVNLWANFAKTGHPTVSQEQEEWKPFTAAVQNCYIIDKQSKCVDDEDSTNMAFWDQIYT